MLNANAIVALHMLLAVNDEKAPPQDVYFFIREPNRLTGRVWKSTDPHEIILTPKEESLISQLEKAGCFYMVHDHRDGDWSDGSCGLDNIHIPGDPEDPIWVDFTDEAYEFLCTRQSPAS